MLLGWRVTEALRHRAANDPKRLREEREPGVLLAPERRVDGAERRRELCRLQAGPLPQVRELADQLCCRPEHQRGTGSRDGRLLRELAPRRAKNASSPSSELLSELLMWDVACGAEKILVLFPPLEQHRCGTDPGGHRHGDLGPGRQSRFVDGVLYGAEEHRRRRQDARHEQPPVPDNAGVRSNNQRAAADPKPAVQGVRESRKAHEPILPHSGKPTAANCSQQLPTADLPLEESMYLLVPMI